MIQPLLLKGLYKYYINICDIFWDVKMENGVFVKIQKNKHKTGTHFTPQLKNKFVKNFPVYNLGIKFCTRPFRIQNHSNIGW